MNKSFIEELKTAQEKLEKDNTHYNSHFLVGVDVTKDGTPNASLMISHGRPFETLGMIDLIMQNLQDTKKEILKKLSTKRQRNTSNRVDELLDELPDELRSKVMSLKSKIDDAISRGDKDALDKLHKELLNFKHDPFPEDDGDGFNINDFKDGL